MKKYLALALALVLVLSLCACGAKKEEETYTPVDTDTVAVGAVVIARDDVPEDEIYDFVSAIFENTAAIGEQHGKGKELDVNFAASVTSVPYHPGAAKYFAEKGINVAAVKDGAGTGEKRDLRHRRRERHLLRLRRRAGQLCQRTEGFQGHCGHLWRLQGQH